MPHSIDLTHRHRQPEIMDEPGLQEDRHFQALRALERINSLSRSVQILWRPICSLAQEIATRPLRILDIATGGGDLPIGLWRKAQRARLAVEITGWDVSPCAVAYARQRAGDKGAGVAFVEANALMQEIPKDFDIITSSLFFHHLDEDQALDLLTRMARAANHLVLINDLVRSTSGFLAAYLVTRLLTTSKVVHTDGPLSVEGAFTIDEIRRLAERAGLQNVSIEKRWPFRFLLSWRRR